MKPTVLQPIQRDGFEFSVGGLAQKAHRSWYRGETCNYNPQATNLLTGDAVIEHVLKGWLPDRPRIGPGTRIAAFGSCFAYHISEWLQQRQYSVLTMNEQSTAYVVQMREGMVNSYALRQQFEWAWENRVPTVELWHGWDAAAFGYDETVRLTTKEIFDKIDVFILTLGLAEVWYDIPTSEVFWRAIPSDLYDPARHAFRVTTVAENRDNIRRIVELIERHRPGATIIFTLSPIPLVATFRPVSCISANQASKAILRAAIDEVYRDNSGFFYWPSYEIIMDLFGPGRWRPDRRHVKSPILEFVMALFESVWCLASDEERNSLDERWATARSAEAVDS